MSLLLISLLMLGQGEPAPPESPPSGPSSAEPAPPRAQATADAGAPAPRQRSWTDELEKELAQANKLPMAERTEAIKRITAKYESQLTAGGPAMPPADVNINNYLLLQAPDQVKLTARLFLLALNTGSLEALAQLAGYPFFLEDKKLDKPEQVVSEWSRQLAGKRLDLLNLYGLDLLTPTEMEKKYGRPPARLSAWPWRASDAWVVVANLEGKAVVLLIRPSPTAWNVVGVHD